MKVLSGKPANWFHEPDLYVGLSSFLRNDTRLGPSILSGCFLLPRPLANIVFRALAASFASARFSPKLEDSKREDENGNAAREWPTVSSRSGLRVCRACCFLECDSCCADLR